MGRRYMSGLRGDRRLQLLGISEMLMRGAVAVMRQWHPLAGRTLARACTAAERVAVDVEAVVRLGLQVRVEYGEIALDHEQHSMLLVNREVCANVAEQRPRWVSEIVAVGGQSFDRRLT